LRVLKAGEETPKGHPAEGKTSIDDLATANVRAGQSCSPPVTGPQSLRSILLESNVRALSC
jgi:hypothetical protein